MMSGLTAALLLLAFAPSGSGGLAPGCPMAQWVMGRGPKPELLDVEALAIEERAAAAARNAWRDAASEIWIRRLNDGESVVALINLTVRPVSVDVIWKELGLGGTRAEPRLRGLLRRKNLGKVHGGFAHRLEAGACALFRVEP